MTTAALNGLGRAAAGVADRILKDIRRGRAARGQFLPPVRLLAEKHSVGSKTIWRALKALEAEGVIAAEPRQGYRVIAGTAVAAGTGPVAYVAGGDPDEWIGSTDRLLNALRDGAQAGGSSLLAVGSDDRSTGAIVKELRAAGASGIVLDTYDAKLVSALRSSGLPTVMVNSWVPEAEIDSVMQDGQLGGILAARHLVARGCGRIAYFGRCEDSAHSLDRFSGAAAGLVAAGLDLRPEDVIRTTRDDAEEKARGLLSRPSAPDGIIAPYRGSSLGLARVIAASGREVRMVGWCPRELWEADWYHPLVITWSVETLAACALARLAERRTCPDQPPLRVKVPTQLLSAREE
ncbi:MAG: GntR family transcriptional regulator [Planctomycetota bacterium]|jgi:DNA-binding LacI/PurR family transcriptional regulator